MDRFDVWKLVFVFTFCHLRQDLGLEIGYLICTIRDFSSHKLRRISLFIWRFMILLLVFRFVCLGLPITTALRPLIHLLNIWLSFETVSFLLRTSDFITINALVHVILGRWLLRQPCIIIALRKSSSRHLLVNVSSRWNTLVSNSLGRIH